MIRLTTEHSASRDGTPVFVDDNNKPMDYADGLKALRDERGWSTADVARICGVSRRTVEGYEQGRTFSEASLRLLMIAQMLTI